MELFLQGIEQSGWLKHVKTVLEVSVFIAEFTVGTGGIEQVKPAHWHSYLLTLFTGLFRVTKHLLKDWLMFGHKFADRCGFLAGDAKEISPIFSQFIDATWQLLIQFPQSFQFNEKYLLTIHDHVYSCQFGTFIGNCQKERLEDKLSSRTYSLWGFLTNNADEFVNPLYDHSSHQDILKPNLSPQNILFWRGLYCRFEVGTHPREPA